MERPGPRKRKVEFLFGVLKSLLTSWLQAAWKAWREFPHWAHFPGLPAAWLQSAFCGVSVCSVPQVVTDAVRRAGSWLWKAGHPGRVTVVLFPGRMLGWWYLVWFISYWKWCETGPWSRSGFSQSGLCISVWQAAGAGQLALKEKSSFWRKTFPPPIDWET